MSIASGRGVASFVPMLERMGMDQLLSEFNNAGSDIPKYALLSAMKEKQDAMRVEEAVKNQSAMQQFQQQQGTVKDQVVGQARQRFNTGGPVSFQFGGLTYGSAPDYELARKYGINLSPYDAPEVRAQKIERARRMQQFEQQMKGSPQIPTAESDAAQKAQVAAYADPSRAKDIYKAPPASGIAAAAKPNTPNTFASAGQSTRVSETKPVGTAGYDPFAETREAYKGMGQTLEGQRAIPQDVLDARKAVQEVGLRSLEASKAEEKEQREGAKKRYESLMASLNKPVFDSAEAMFRLAGGIDPTRGKAIGSAAQAMGAMLGERRKEATAAEKEYLESQTESRRLAGLNRQIEMANVERQYAYANKDWDRAGQLDRQIKELEIARVKEMNDIRDKMEQRRISEMTAKASAASAARVPFEEQVYRQMYPSVLQRITSGAKPTPAQLEQAAKETFEAIRGAGRDIPGRRAIKEEELDIKRRALMTKDPGYQLLSIKRGNEQDPVKRAAIDAQMRAIEKKNGIDSGEESISSPPAIGTVMDGYRFKGGNPSDKNNWEKV